VFKQVATSSVFPAFLATLVLWFFNFFIYGLASATFFSVVAFPVAIVLGTVLTYPLILFRDRFKITEVLSFLMFALAGLFVGGLIPLLVVGNKYLTISDWDIYGVYGIYGAAYALFMWFNMRRL